MFVKNFDPDDPRWAHWNLKHLEPLTSKQNEAFWDDDVSKFIKFYFFNEIKI